MQFSRLAEAMEELEQTTSQTDMIGRLADLFRDASEDDIALASYYLLGRIGPGYEPLTLDMGDALIQEAIARASGKSEEEVADRADSVGDMGDLAARLVEPDELDEAKTLDAEGNLLLEDVDAALKEIARAQGSGSDETKVDALAGLLASADRRSRRYLGRLAAGSMRLGVGDMTVLDGLATAYLGGKEDRGPLERAYNVCSDVGRVAEVLVRSGLDGVKRIRIAMNRPLRPMLAQRVSKLSEIAEKIGSDRIAVEEKYDGQRIQAHKKGDDVRLFSRRLSDITDQYPDVVENVRRHVSADTAILDGEAVAYDFEEQTYEAFQELMQRRRKYDVEDYADKIPVKYVVFDVLYVDGHSRLSRSYPQRRDVVEDLVPDGKHIAPAGRIVTEELDAVEDFFQDALHRKLEGVICKSCADDSHYEAGAREWSWIKWKPSYASSMEDTFDLVIVGAYHGKGDRAGTYGSLLCAAYNAEADTFETLCKLGSGFTDEELKGLPDKLSDARTDDRPARVAASDRVEPDVWFTPAYVAEVLASEITQSPTHSVGQDRLDRPLALRFPRFERWRPEKAPDQATSTSEIVQMYRDVVGDEAGSDGS